MIRLLLRPSAPALFGAFFVLGSGAASGFATVAPASEAQRNQDRILSEIRQIQSQLATLTETQATLVAAVETLLADREETGAADRRSRAETGNALERLERQVATLSEALRGANERLSELMSEVESVREAQRRAAVADAALAAAPEGAGEGAEAGADADETPEEADAGRATVLDEPSTTEIYLEAQADYYQGRYDLAIQGFEQVAAGGGELADNAHYLIGESLLAQDELLPALEQFEIVIERFEDSGKIGEAWYKKGVILARLGHESDAREIFEDILDVFAGTPAARLARRQLEAMSPGGPGSR